MPSRANSHDERDAEPLLSHDADRSEEHDNHVIFSVTDDDEGETTRVFDRVPLQSIPAVPLRSTIASREAGQCHHVLLSAWHAC